MSAINVKNLTKQFKGFKAVDDLSFEIEKNHVVGFLGPNGAGKTTTLRMLVGLSKPTKGEINIAGIPVIFGKSASNEKIGYLPELPNFYNWMTGFEYLTLIADIFKIDSNEREQRVSKLLKTVDLIEVKNKRIGSYSGGMKQRLGIAQALINDPEVIILDEPVSALDPIGRKEVLKVIETLKENKTVLFSTHILSDVDRICDDIILINHGKLIVSSPLAKLKERYAKPILEIEFFADPEKISKELKKEKWVEKFEKNGNQLKIWPKGEGIIEKNIPFKYFADKSIGILKYGLTLPETEDLFLELLGGKYE